MQEKIMIIDSGSQYTQLIARRVRELNVYCEIYPFNKFPEPDPSVKGVILSGSPFFFDDPLAPKIDVSSFRGKLPLLGIGYGAQYLACSNGAEAASEGARQYKAGVLSVVPSEDPLFNEVEKSTKVWVATGETLTKLPAGFHVLASTESNPAAAFAVEGEKSWGVEFHPEVYHTSQGSKLMKNFVVDICGCRQDWTPALFAETTIKELREKLGSDKVLLGLSGGVDSSVAAMLLHRAIGSNLVCIFVDHGLLRKNEFEDVLESYKSMGLNVIGVRAGDKFLSDLKGITDPEQKRKIIGRDFIEVFDAEAQKLTGIKWLAQGTIYPDIIESVSIKNPKLAVKSHHNVGGLPEKMNLKLVEPLNLLFKDEVRRVGTELGVPDAIINRHPFPGPGLGVRILGDITPEKVTVLQNADKVFIDGLKRHGLYDKVWQAGVILLPVSSVGVKGEQRTYENAVALRAVASLDGMTADWIHLPYDFLAEISNEIIDKVDGINRVVYDISSKPPATIEWE